MTPTDLTLMLGLLVTAMSSVGVPLWLNRRAAALARAEREAEAAAEARATEVVSWEKITLVLERERDSLSVKLREAGVEHRNEILEMRNSFAAEADRLRQRTDAEVDRANERIQQLANEVGTLRSLLPVNPLGTGQHEGS